MYNEQPKGLHLGRYEKGDEHIVLGENGSILKAHTVRPIHFHIDRQRYILELYD